MVVETWQKRRFNLKPEGIKRYLGSRGESVSAQGAVWRWEKNKQTNKTYHEGWVGYAQKIKHPSERFWWPPVLLFFSSKLSPKLSRPTAS